MMGLGKPGDPFGGGAESDPVPAWQARIASLIARCVLAGAGGPRNTTLSWR